MLNTHTHVYIQAHTWTCIFLFLLQPCEMALWLFLLDRLSFPVLQNLSFNFTPLQVLPQWLSPSALLCFLPPVAPLYPIHIHIFYSYSYSPPWSSLCVFLLYFLTRDGLCVTHVCIPTNKVRVLNKKSNKQLFYVCRWQNKSDLRNYGLNINMR